MDLAFEVAQLGREPAGQVRQQLAVDEHPRPLHVGQDREQRHLDPFEEGPQLVVLELGGERLPQAQHGLAVVAAVARRGRNGNRGERALGPPLPRDIRIGAQFRPQDLPGEIVESVGTTPGIEDEAGERRVVGDASELHARPPQHDPVVLDVVSRLGDRGVGEQLAQRRERSASQRRQVSRRGVARELAVRRDVGEGQVPGSSRRPGQRESDKLRAHRVERRRLNVQGNERRAPDLGDHPGYPPDIVEHRCRGGGRHGRQRRDRRRTGRERRGAQPHEAVELGDERAELELGEQLAQAGDVRRADAQVVEVERHRRVATDGDEIAGQPGELAVLQQGLAGPLPGHFRRAREDRVEVAVGAEQLESRLLPDPLDARHVVGTVAHERQVIHDALGRDAEPLAGIGLVDPLLFDGRGAASARVEQDDARADELVEVLVARHDDGLEPPLRRRGGERADHVVGLEAFDADDRDAERVQDLFDALDGALEVLLQLLVQLLARRLVFGVGLLAERDADIVYPAEVSGAVFLVKAQQEVGRAPGGGGVLAARGGEGAGDHRKESAVDERVAVNEEQPLGGRGRHGRKITGRK